MMTTKDPLVVNIEQLQHALAQPWQGKEQSWATGMRSALRGLELALGRQPAPSDKNVLSHTELQRREISPGLKREAHSLRDEQAAILKEVDLLIGHLDGDTVQTKDLPMLKQIGDRLVKSLQHFCATNNSMVFENVMRDTGAGD